MIENVIQRVVAREAVSADDMHAAFSEMMDGHSSDAQKAALLVGLRMKGESFDEILGAARAMRERVKPIASSRRILVDTCGTGGDGSGTFNVSTAAAIVASAAGVAVAKHGNRAVSSSCGSADVLEQLGVRIDLNIEQTEAVLEETAIAFLFAPSLHPAMAAVAPVRRELGIRTIFNLLGPLTNPAEARRQVLGVYRRDVVGTMTRVLAALGGEHVLVVHGEDGLDEISVSAATLVSEWKDGKLAERRIEPSELGLRIWPLAELRGGAAADNARIICQVFEGKQGGARDIVLANAGAAIYVGGSVPSLRDGVDAARSAIDSGAALRKLEELVNATVRRSEASA